VLIELTTPLQESSDHDSRGKNLAFHHLKGEKKTERKRDNVDMNKCGPGVANISNCGLPPPPASGLPIFFRLHILPLGLFANNLFPSNKEI
jgi:hypothetical protein